MRSLNLYTTAPPSPCLRATGSDEAPIALRIAQVWLALGVVALVCVPALRGSNAWIGSWPLWLVVVPSVNWLILGWRDVLPAAREVLGWLQRRRAPAPAQGRPARRMRKSNSRRRVGRKSGALLAAALFR